MLKIQNLSHAYNNIIVFDDFNFSWPKDKKTLGLLGANGSGKTTLFNIICGDTIPHKGSIFWNRQDISRLIPEKRHQLGFSRTFQIPAPFKSMTVEENINVATFNIQCEKDWVDYILSKFRLWDKKDILSSKLNPQDLRMLEVARAIASKPKLLLLDESFAGLRLDETFYIMNVIKEFQKESDFLILIIEHNLSVLKKMCDHLLALSLGVIIEEGSPESCLSSKSVRQTYFQESI